MFAGIALQSLIDLGRLYRPVAAGLRLPNRLIVLTYTSDEMLRYLYREYEKFIEKNNMENIALNIITDYYNRCASGPDRRLVAMAKLLARRAAERDYNDFLNSGDGRGQPW